MEFDSTAFPMIKADSYNNSQSSDEVFFIVNIKELFNVDLSYPGIKTSLNKAFMFSKQYIPVDTGITKRSYSIREIDNNRVKIFFDKTKVIGQIRKGRKVDVYYIRFIAEHAKRFNWLTIVIYQFYTELFKEIKKLKIKQKKNEQNIKGSEISTATFLIFFDQLKENYKQIKEEAKKLKDIERENKKRKEDIIREKKRLLRIQNSKIEDIKEV